MADTMKGLKRTHYNGNINAGMAGGKGCFDGLVRENQKPWQPLFL